MEKLSCSSCRAVAARLPNQPAQARPPHWAGLPPSHARARSTDVTTQKFGVGCICLKFCAVCSAPCGHLYHLLMPKLEHRVSHTVHGADPSQLYAPPDYVEDTLRSPPHNATALAFNNSGTMLAGGTTAATHCTSHAPADADSYWAPSYRESIALHQTRSTQAAEKY